MHTDASNLLGSMAIKLASFSSNRATRRNLEGERINSSRSPQHWQAYRGKTSTENQRKSADSKPAGSRWRAFSTGGFFALPAGWCFDWVVRKAEWYSILISWPSICSRCFSLRPCLRCCSSCSFRMKDSRQGGHDRDRGRDLGAGRLEGRLKRPLFAQYFRRD